MKQIEELRSQLLGSAKNVRLKEGQQVSDAGLTSHMSEVVLCAHVSDGKDAPVARLQLVIHLRPSSSSEKGS